MSLMDDRQAIKRRPLQELSLEVAERIAAGEVIERPVSVIKELLENALDAGAQDIRIEIRGGGLLLIRVADDGYGIPENELERVFLRHTTTKLEAFDDLTRLQTLGFRGEALASIAAVAELTILSRAIETEQAQEDQAAPWLTARGGNVTQRGYRARVHGTTISVRDLFYNVPARLTYTRATRTENGHIVQMVQRYAMGYPSVRFHLQLDEREVIQTGGSGNLGRTLTELYHLPVNELLSPIDTSDGQHYKITGSIGNRVLAQSNRQYMVLFINGRWIQSRALQNALEQGYRTLLPRGKHPLLLLHIEVPAHEVDVNVHPAKSDVHLLQERAIAEALTEALQKALERTPAHPETVAFPGPTLATQKRLPGPRRRGLHIAETSEGYHAEVAQPGTAEVIASLKPLAQLQEAVILAEAPDGSLYLVDQHRAHERIIYEHLRRTYAGMHADTVADAHLLLEPVIVEMKRHQAEILEQRLPMLRGLGIECERFGGRSFLVRSIPAGEGMEQLAAHLQEVVSLAAEDSTNWEDQLLVALACRSALRRGRTLGSGEQRTLLKALATASAPAVCPHGSPILLHYSRSFLIDKFDW